MAGGVARVGDILGPGGILTAPASTNIFVNGRPAALEGCIYTPHPCFGTPKCTPGGIHPPGFTMDIPSDVYFDGIPPITNTGFGICGHKVMIASDDVIVVGGPLGSIASLVLARALGGGF